MLGEPGEGNASQYALVSPLETLGARTHCKVICNDVIYPAGGVDQYEGKFYRPYRDYKRPIYAVPGQPRLVRRPDRLYVTSARAREV